MWFIGFSFALIFCILVFWLPLINTFVQWLVLWPCIRKVSGSILGPVAFLRGVCLFSLVSLWVLRLLYKVPKNIHVRQTGTCELPAGVCLRTLVCLLTRTCDKLPICATPPSPPETAGIGSVKALRPWVQAKASGWMGCLWLQLKEDPESNRKNYRLKENKRIQLTPGRCGKSQNVSSVVSLSIRHIDTSCSMQAIHFMTLFFFLMKLHLWILKHSIETFNVATYLSNSASPCSHQRAFFFFIRDLWR